MVSEERAQPPDRSPSMRCSPGRGERACRQAGRSRAASGAHPAPRAEPVVPAPSSLHHRLISGCPFGTQALPPAHKTHTRPQGCEERARANALKRRCSGARKARQEGRFHTALSHGAAPRERTRSVERVVFGRPFGPQGGIKPPLLSRLSCVQQRYF